MAGQTNRWQGLSSLVRGVPLDLAAIVATVALTCVTVSVPSISNSPIRVLVGAPFLLLVPGYAFVAALFPSWEANGVNISSAADTTFDLIGRYALALGASITIVPFIGLLLSFSPWGIQLAPIVFSVSVFTLFTTGVAAYRRRGASQPPQNPPASLWRYITERQKSIFGSTARTGTVLNVLIVVSLLLALGTTGYAFLNPESGDQFTEFYLLSEDSDNGFNDDTYQITLERGVEREIPVGINNHEGDTVEYTVVTNLQRISVSNNSTVIQEEWTLDQFNTVVEHNETWHQDRAIEPPVAGDDLRLTYLLYQGSAPANPTAENAYRVVYLWVTVEPSS